MIAVDTNNSEYRQSTEPHEGRLGSHEGIASNKTGAAVGGGGGGEDDDHHGLKFKVTGQENHDPLPLKQEVPDAHDDDDDDDDVDSHDSNDDDNDKPRDLPPVVHTNNSSSDIHQADLFSASFDGEADYFDQEHNGFGPSPMVGAPLTTVSISETEVSTPSVKDLIKFFGSPLQRNNSGGGKDPLSGGSLAAGATAQRRPSTGSSQSVISRQTDAPMGMLHHRHRDDDSSLGDFSATSMPVHYEPHGSNNSPGRSHKTMCELDMLREQSIVSSRRRLQTRSAARRDRLHYKLNDGRKGMSQKDLNRSRTFLPADKLIAMKQQQQDQRTNPALFSEPEVYVWLLSPAHKVFEVVRVPYSMETSIGDVLVMARAAALDPVLAEQRYVSLCNSKLELVAPSLPINFLFHRGKKKEKQSIMAVPEGSTAVAIREIQHALTANRRVRKWLKQEDIFRPLSEEEKLEKRRERQKKKNEESKKMESS